MRLPTRTVIPFLILPLTIGCGGKAQVAQEEKTSGDDGKETVLYECFSDPKMENGVWLLSPREGSRVPVGILRLGKGTADPSWDLCQWNNTHDLSGTEAEQTGYGTTYSNGVHTFARNDAGEFTMILDSSQEYPSARKDGQPWCHMLVQSSFGRIPLRGMKKLELTFEERLVKVENRMGDDFNPNLHTAQALFYFSIADLSPSSEWNNKSIWLGVSAWDYRSGLTQSPEVSFDKGTATYIYQMASVKTFAGASLNDGRWHKCKVDVLKAVKDAISALQSKGEFKDATVDDFFLSGMNFGWEMPGSFYGALQVRDFSLKTDKNIK